MLALAVAFWLLVRPYQGIYHDARLYTLQALARLSPESLGQDVFLRFGSQDAYTIFSPAYAAVIRMLGVEDAARLLTLLGHAWWMVAAFLIARHLLGRSHAALALAIIAALPGYYGAWEVFQYAEPFLTPRLYAEAAVLSAIAAMLGGRRTFAVALTVVGMVLHPLMAMGGLLLLTACALPRSWGWLLIAFFGAGLGVALLISILAPHYPLQIFDDDWLTLIRMRSPFLTLSDWGAEAWKGVAMSLIPLWILSGGWNDARAKRLFRLAVIVGVLGLVTTGIGATLFKVVLITQGQAWRWSWIASVLLPIAAVGGVQTIWRTGLCERSAILLALTGWLLFGLPAVLLLVLSGLIWTARRALRPQLARPLFLISVSIAAVGAILWARSVPLLGAGDPTALVSPVLQMIRLMLADGVIGIAVVVAAWSALPRANSSWLPAIAAAGIAAAAVCSALPAWLREDYSVEPGSQLSVWKATIPVDAEVLWPEDAAASWLLLDRRSFVSADQTAGVVFSHDAATVMLRRSQEVRLILPPSFAFSATANKIFQMTPASLEWTCRHSSVAFIIARQRLPQPQAAPPLLVRQRTTGISEPMYLFDCRQLRRLPGLDSSTL